MMKSRTRFKASAQTLASIDLFRALAADDRAAIAVMTSGRDYRDGECIIAQDDVDHDVFFVVTGTVRVTYFTAAGKQIEFRDLGAGAMFGEVSALDGGRRSAEVDAVGSAFVLRLERHDFLALLEIHPGLARTVMRNLAGVVRALSDRVIEFSSLAVRNRVRAEILRLARGRGVQAGAARIEGFPTHHEIANRISTHREAVTREMGTLARAGLLRKERGAIVVPDLGRLEQIVETVS